MEQFFMEIVNRGLAASLLVLVVVLLRMCFKRMPKWVCPVLWGFVAFRLLCPVSLETTFSLMPDVAKITRQVEGYAQWEKPESIVLPEETEDLQVQSGKGFAVTDFADATVKDAVDVTVGDLPGEVYDKLPNTGSVSAENSMNNASNEVPDATPSTPIINTEEVPKQQTTWSLSVLVWLVGTVLMAFYGVVSYLKVKRQVRACINVQENIYYCDDIDTPFVFGLFKPGIYLPSGMDEATMEYVLRHEREHLRRGDQWWKLFGFSLLSVFWFHPLLWVAYVLFCKDVEFACDERVIKEFEEDTRREYAQALLSCSIGKRVVLLCPTAFGENGVKGRIRSVMSYKKVTIPILIGTLVVCLLIGIVFLTDRRDPYGIDSDNLVLGEVSLSEDVAEDIAEDIAELMEKAWKEKYQLENFRFIFSWLSSGQEENLLRVSVEVDKTSLREPENHPLIAGMKKAQSELTYEAERDYAQRMIDSMLAQLKQEVKVRICEPAIFVTLDERNHYELYYGNADRTPLKEYYKQVDTAQEEFLGYLSVYQKANINPPMDVVGSDGYKHVEELENPEKKSLSLGLSISSINWHGAFLYYGDVVFDNIAAYNAKKKEELPWELLGEEIKIAYSNHGEYWSEREELLECTGNGTLYRVKGYEDTYRVALVYEQNRRKDDFTGISNMMMMGDSYGRSTVYEPITVQSVIGEAKEEEIQPGKTTYHMVICEHVNGLWYHEGRELFQQRMHLENSVAVNGMSMEEELLWTFLAELNAATFTSVTTRGSLDYETIIFKDALGLKHSLRLNEEGYVKVEAGSTTLIVKIDEEISQRVMERARATKAQQAQEAMKEVFPVEKVFVKEEGYEAVYEEMKEWIEQRHFNVNIATAWHGETGYYISKVPVYYCGISEGVISKSAIVFYFSQDFTRSAAAQIGWNEYKEPTLIASGFYHSWLDLMKQNPSEEYIVVHGILNTGISGIALLNKENEILGLDPLRHFPLEAKEDLYQTVYSDELAVSYEELTAEENLIWISRDGKAPDATPTPTPTPIDLSTRTYHTAYEACPYAAFSAEDWLKTGRLEVPFVRSDVLNTDVMSERYAMWYIPEEAIAVASTKDLARVAAFNYTWGIFDIYDRPSFYLKIARDRFNAFDALFARADMVDAVLAEYEASGFYLKSQVEEQNKRDAEWRENGVVTLEMLLATDEAFDKMNGKQGAVLQAVLEKMGLRKTGLFYAEECTDGFFSYIKEHEFLGSKWYDYLMRQYADDKTVMAYLENACYPSDAHEVYSPRPEDLYVPAITPEPVVSEDTVIHTLNLPLLGTECRIDVIGKQREDMDYWGVRELKVYAGEELVQSILIQEAIDADGVDGSVDIGYTDCPYPNLTASLRDVNFDDHPDIEVWGWSPNNSIPYYYWCWNPKTEQFEYAFTLQLTDVDEERRHLISYQKVGGGVYYTERYRVTKDNKLELAERMTEEYWANTYESWKEAYLHVIASFPDNMIDPYGFRSNSDWTNPEKYIYLGIHDFTTDGTPELIIGDGASLAVFTYKQGRIEKCIDVTMQCCWQCIDDVAFRDNTLLTSCSGSDGSGYTAVAYRNGAWTTAVYCEYHPKKCTINGETATYEEFCNVVPFEPKDWEGTIKEYGMRDEFMDIVVTEGEEIYFMDTWTKERVPLDESFDFNSIRW